MSYTVKETITATKEYDLNALMMKDWPIKAIEDAKRILSIPKHYAFMADKENNSYEARRAYLVKLVEAGNEMLDGI